MRNKVIFSVLQILLTLCQYKESRAIDDYGYKRYSDTYYDTPPYTPSLSELALLEGRLGVDDDTNYIPSTEHHHHHHHDDDDDGGGGGVDASSSLHHLHHHHHPHLMEDGDDDHYYHDYYANGFGYDNDDADIELLKYKMNHYHLPDHHHFESEPFFPLIPPTPTFKTKNFNSNDNKNRNKKKNKKNNDVDDDFSRWTSKLNGLNKKRKSEIKPVTEHRPDDFMYDFRTKLHSIR